MEWRDDAEVAARAPGFDTVVEATFGGSVERDELGDVERHLVAVAILAALGRAESQLAFHVHAAGRLGVTVAELLSVCERVATLAGLPRAMSATAVVHEVAGGPRPVRQRVVGLVDHDTVVTQFGRTGPPVVLVHAAGAAAAAFDRLTHTAGALVRGQTPASNVNVLPSNS